MKAIKRELKEWEHEFVSNHGRKPDKKDIAADRSIAKKYKAYAKMKAEGDGGADQEEAGKRDSEATLRASVAISQPQVSSKNSKSHKSPSRAAEDNEGSGEAEESFKTVYEPVVPAPSSRAFQHHQPQQGVFSNYPQYSGEPEMDEEDRAAQEFFNNSYASGRLAITKEDLYTTTSIANVTNSQAQRNAPVSEYTRQSTAGVLPSNFKIRKSTIAAGPIATDTSIHTEALQQREIQRDNLYRESDSSYTLRTYTPPPQTQIHHQEIQYPSAGYITTRQPSTQLQNHELADFLSRREQLQTYTNPSPPPQQQQLSSTPPLQQYTQRSFTPQPRAPSALGSYTTVPSLVTQIRVVTPTSAQQISIPPADAITEDPYALHQHPLFTSSPRKSSKALDLPIPAPPIVVQLDDIDSEESEDEVDEKVVTSSHIGNTKTSKNVVVMQQRTRKQPPPKPQELEDSDIIKRKKATNGFFPVTDDTEEADVEEVVPFHAPAPIEKTASSKTLLEPEVIVEPKKPEPVKSDDLVITKDEAEFTAAITEPKPADVVATIPPSIAAPTFVVNPKMFSRIPIDGLLKCRVIRKKNLLDKTHPTFILHNETDDKFLLAARKRKKSATVNYLISTSQDDLSKDSTHYIAKLKANFQRTNFILYDARFYNKNAAAKGLKEMACVTYSKTVLPRELNVAIPALAIEENSENGTKDIMADIKSQNKDKLLFLKNKPPRWNETTQSHCLNFGGRVTQPSIKNFQLVMEGSETIILQFGRCGPDAFTMDARYPLTPIEAFAIAVTTFDAYDSA